MFKYKEEGWRRWSSKYFTLGHVAVYIATSLRNLHRVRGKKISLLTSYDPRSWLEDKIFEVGRSLLRAKVEVMDNVHMIRAVITIFSGCFMPQEHTCI